MKISEESYKAGKGSIDDKVDIPGTLIQPDSKSDVLVFIQAGHDGHHEIYKEFLGEPLGEEFNVYISELRHRGLRSFKTSIDDVFEIDSMIREKTGASKVVYVGHCTGMNAAVASAEKHGTDVKGLYGISTYPSLGDILTADENPEKKSLKQRLADSVSSFTFGLSDYPLKEAGTDKKTRFAIAGRDHSLRTYKPEVAARFMKIFGDRFENSTSRVFPGRTHSFNTSYRYRNVFNRGDPDPLVDDIREFVYEVTAGSPSYEKTQEAVA